MVCMQVVTAGNWFAVLLGTLCGIGPLNYSTGKRACAARQGGLILSLSAEIGLPGSHSKDMWG